MAKKQYIGVNGVARNVKKQYIGINGVARKVKKGYIGTNGVARQFFSGGTPLSELTVGTSVYTNVNGVKKEFIVVHQGLPSSLYDSSCNGTWLLMKDIYENRAFHYSDLNQYHYSNIHTYLNGDFIALFDTGVQNLIKQAVIPYCPGYGSSSVNSGASGLSVKIFLLAGYEVGYTTSDANTFPVDGSCLNYFTTYAANRRESSTNWWLRSPSTTTTGTAWMVCYDGSYATANCSTSYGIRPAFILPSDATVNPETMTINT